MGEWIQCRLRRITRERLAEYGAAIQAAGEEEARNHRTGEVSVDQLVSRLLDQWYRKRARSARSAAKRKAK